MLFVLFIFFIASVHCAERKCDPIDELQCNDGSCITKFEWCDSKVNCRDGSDEMFCNGTKPCHKEIHFECENKKCIPISAVCDKFDDCYDGSDEDNCNSSVWLEDVSRFALTTSIYSSSHNFSSDMPIDTSVNKAAVDRAAEYLLSVSSSDYGWEAFTPRAVIALSMAGSASPLAKKNKELILKQLNIQILQDLMQKRKITLSRLALYINALHATCQDPRDFQGTDLVAQLRSETDIAIKMNTSIPLAFLTLCLSNGTRYEDNYKLADMYWKAGKLDSRTGSRALIILAMSCIMHKETTNVFGAYMSDFIDKEINNARIADIYTQALFKQASIAAGFTYPYNLQSKQLPDGSFGDLLSTYYAIPVLLNSSLLDLVCKNPKKGSASENDFEKTEGRNEIAYSLWITSGKNPITHSTKVKFYGKKSLFDIMTMAAARDPLYRFLYEESEQEGKMVYSVAGIPNDIEGGTFWTLYSADTDDVKVNVNQGLTLLDKGVDKYFADDEEHFIFWLRRSLPAS